VYVSGPALAHVPGYGQAAMPALPVRVQANTTGMPLYGYIGRRKRLDNEIRFLRKMAEGGEKNDWTPMFKQIVIVNPTAIGKFRIC
jgi:hypothetical protein